MQQSCEVRNLLKGHMMVVPMSSFQHRELESFQIDVHSVSIT